MHSMSNSFSSSVILLEISILRYIALTGFLTHFFPSEFFFSRRTSETRFYPRNFFYMRGKGLSDAYFCRLGGPIGFYNKPYPSEGYCHLVLFISNNELTVY